MIFGVINYLQTVYSWFFNYSISIQSQKRNNNHNELVMRKKYVHLKKKGGRDRNCQQLNAGVQKVQFFFTLFFSFK